jgi:hypothetical protein
LNLAVAPDVDINHSKNKHILTKGSTHNQVYYALFGLNIITLTALFQIHSLTGAVVSARGRYKALGDCSNNDPLHLHVSADSEEKLKAAVERIHKIMGPNPLKVRACCLPEFVPVYLAVCRNITSNIISNWRQAHMASSVCTVGFEPTVGFDALAEIQGPEVDSGFVSAFMHIFLPG